MDVAGFLAAIVAGGGPGGPGALLADLVAEAPDDPILLMGLMVAAWLPLCAVLLGFLAVMARVQVTLGRRRAGSRTGLVLAPQARATPVTRRFITTGRRTNGLLAVGRLALAVGAVLGLSVIVLASSAPLLLTALRG